MRRFLLIFFLFPLVLLSQYKRTIFLEGGTSINQSFYPNETLSGDIYGWCGTGNPGPIGTYNSTVQRFTTFSFYSKLGIETPIVQKKHFSFSIPFVFGYREQKEHFYQEIEDIYNNTFSYKYSVNTEHYSRIVSLIFGPKITFDFKKWSFFTSINMNAELFLFGKTTNTTNNDYGSNKSVSSYGGNCTFDGMMFNLSAQNCILYNLNSKFAIGLTNDVFFYNIDPDVIKYSKKDNHLFNFGYGANSTIINAGIRLQYSF